MGNTHCIGPMPFPLFSIIVWKQWSTLSKWMFAGRGRSWENGMKTDSEELHIVFIRFDVLSQIRGWTTIQSLQSKTFPCPEGLKALKNFHFCENRAINNCCVNGEVFHLKKCSVFAPGRETEGLSPMSLVISIHFNSKDLSWLCKVNQLGNHENQMD